MSYLGKNVVLSDGTGQLSDGKAEWTYNLDNDAASTKLTVKDSDGKTVYTKTVDSTDNTAGTHTFSWDGKSSSGDQQSDGLYTLTVTSTAKDGTAVTSSIGSKAEVTGVDLSGSSPQLVIGNSEVALTSVTMVSN
jgi:flagellar basal-body rod modification protein FlgD